MIYLYVMTTARTGRDDLNRWPHVHETMRQIEDERLPGVPLIVAVDGEEQPPEGFNGRWSVLPYIAPHLRGSKFLFWELLRHAADARADALIFEDDLDFCRNAVRRMVGFSIPDDLAWVQFFSPKVNQTARVPIGLWRPPLSAIGFSQALKLPARTVQTLVAWALDPAFQAFNQSDDALGLAAARLGLRFGVHVPDLVQHVGDFSEASEGATLDVTRTSHMFSPDLDALTLYQRDDLYR